MSDFIVIGRGNVGRALASALQSARRGVAFATRTQGWDEVEDESDARIRLVCVGEKDLGDVLLRLPPSTRERTVLVQNGFLEAQHDDLSGFGRGLIWFMAKGDFFAELAPSVFHGAVAARVVDALAAGGREARLVEERASFVREMIIKGIWNGVVGLPLACHELTLREYLERREDELIELVTESAAAASAFYGVDVDPAQALTVLRQTTSPIDFVRGGFKALPYRNGAIAAFGRQTGIPTPVTDRLLAIARDRTG